MGSDSEREEKEGLVTVKTTEINVPKERVTSVWDPNLLEEMLESVRSKGILEPVALLEVDGDLWLIDGLHRLEAAEKLGIPTVPAIIKKGTKDDLLIENIVRNRQRGKSNPAQEAEVLAFLTHKRGFPIETAAKQMGMSEGWAKRLLRIAALPEETKDLIKHGKIPVTGAFYIADLPNPQHQILVSRDASTYGYNAYQIKARVAALLNPDREPDQGETTFNAQGKPQKIPIRCHYCQTELPDTGKQYIWCCEKCEKLSLDLYQYYANTYMKPPPSPPETPPHPP